MSYVTLSNYNFLKEHFVPSSWADLFPYVRSITNLGSETTVLSASQLTLRIIRSYVLENNIQIEAILLKYLRRSFIQMCLIQ